jgi:hypothetical protein
MTGRPPKITGALREELWRRYKAGETILGIGHAFGLILKETCCERRKANACSAGHI